jgi:8-oxo-dGTP pyrophosphatase MutT (NUDIX family)
MNTPVEPKPAASVLLVRPTPPGAAAPFEVYMIRRRRGLKFLGGFYAFPGGKVDAADASPASLARCHGLSAAAAEVVLASGGPLPASAPPALAYWFAAVRELLEETGLLLAVDAVGDAIDGHRAGVPGAIDRMRSALMAGEASFAVLLERAGWFADCRPFRYLSHFVTPKASPIRFSAAFFLCPVPAGQTPRLYTEETSEGFWIAPAEGHRRFRTGELAMAEPAEYALGYLSQFGSLDELWAAHADLRHKFHGIIDRIDRFWERFDWTASRWR